MSPETFCDGIGEITLTGSVVRIDLVSLSPTEKDGDGRPVPVFRQRIVMPVEGFVHSLGPLERTTRKLMEEGRIAPPPATSRNFP
ncbi:hypothetical protein JL101_012260 [Skermanella rosea]|uniref:hypothetical protein n=1 Tax=Skermanella rosea TaxID=1817965 RepID=UPI001933936C|nr:hypothetical protein [Skermanella rosea]UEM06169.1 hypothetical protein JL101_012260 [Skermanella rosea]